MSHRYRLVPSAIQAEAMSRHCAQARFVWNLGLEQRNLYRPTLGPTPRYAAQSRQLTEARAACDWLRAGSSHVQQAALRDLDQAFRNWWAGSHGRPTWRVKGRNEGFVVRDVFIKVLNRKWASVHVPKCGYIKFRLSRLLPEKYGMARVTLDRAGRWHISFSAPQPQVDRQPTGRLVGIDRGIIVTVALSDGQMLSCPTPTPEERARRARLQRKVSRQQKGSNRRERTRLAVAKLSAKQADRRTNWVEKVSTQLVRDYDVVVFEDLNIKKMTSRHSKGSRGLRRDMGEQSWGLLVHRTTDKAKASIGCRVVKVNPAYTSQRCHKCQYVNSKNRKSQADFKCLRCNHQDHADTNAAKNILAAGLAVIGREGAGVTQAIEPSTSELVVA